MKLTSGGGKPNLAGLPYTPPTGPKSLGNRGPGLGGSNLGCYGTQGKHSDGVSSGGRVGLGGTNHGTSPTQGRR